MLSSDSEITWMLITNPELKAQILSAMADPDSGRIMQAIRSDAKGVVKIGTELRIPISSMYRKISILKEAGLVFASTYEITSDGKKQELYSSSVLELKIDFHGTDSMIDLVPSSEIVNRIWLKLFSSSGESLPVH